MLKRWFQRARQVCGPSRRALSSVDARPWRHPYLTATNIRRFREYSEQVWRFASEHVAKAPSRPLGIAFTVNMAQNMYKWALMVAKLGPEAVLYVHPMELSAVNAPQWEEFDGEYGDLLDGEGFLREHSDIPLGVPCRNVPMDDCGLLDAVTAFEQGNRGPLLRLLASVPSIRHEALLAHSGLPGYYKWAAELSAFDVICSASTPLAPYASGKPYCYCPVGGDMQLDCGRADAFGEMMTLGCNAARFFLISNPHMLGHSRRLGFTNGVYLPYPMDSGRYCPGPPVVRRQWEQRFGRGTFVLSTSRLDSDVKGQGGAFIEALAKAAAEVPTLRFLFLNWGTSASQFQDRVREAGLGDRVFVLSPVGKKRLIDYYRSCDVVLDHFVWGYYGSTALEAAAVGKPVIMKIRAEHYGPLYAGDVAPVENASTAEQIHQALVHLARDVDYRLEKGRQMRQWLVRNHGEQKTGLLLLALLRLSADGVALPGDLVNPLRDPETPAEMQYHAQCREEAR